MAVVFPVETVLFIFVIVLGDFAVRFKWRELRRDLTPQMRAELPTGVCIVADYEPIFRWGGLATFTLGALALKLESDATTRFWVSGILMGAGIISQSLAIIWPMFKWSR